MKSIVVLCIVMAMVLSMAVPAFAQASDVGGHWAEATIHKWVDKGFILGYPDGTFRPDNLVTRAEFMALANRSFGFSETAEVNVSDVSTKDWFYREISRALAVGYIKGYGDGTIRPYNHVTREEIAVMIARMLNLNLAAIDETTNVFSDTGDRPDWSRKAIAAIAAKGFIRGNPNGAFEPLRAATRAEAVAILDRVLTALEKGTVYFMRSIKSIEATNGTVKVILGGNARTGLTQEDFQVTAKLNDLDYTLKNLTFNSTDNSFQFTPVPQTIRKQTLTIVVAAADDSLKVWGSAEADVTITSSGSISYGGGGGGSPSVSDNTIKNVVLTNGSLKVNFYGSMTGLSAEDFTITATLDGNPYELRNLSFDPATNTFSFTPLVQGSKDMTLEVFVTAASSKIKGQASGKLAIEKSHAFIILDSLTIDYGEEDMQGCDVGFTLSQRIGNLAGISVALYDDAGNALAENNATQALLGQLNRQGGDKSIICPFGAQYSLFASEVDAATEGDWEGGWIGALEEPSRIVINVTNSNGIMYYFDSQDKVWVDLEWAGKVPYENVGPSKLIGLNAFSDIQPGVDAVNPEGTVIVADGEYQVGPTEDQTYYGYGIVVYKPLTLLGAQAGVRPVENKERKGGETVIVGSIGDEDANGGGAVTVCRNAGAVTIDGFTFKYNEIGVDLRFDSIFEGYGRDKGITVVNNRFIDNFIDVLVDNNDGGIQNYILRHNVFGTYEYNEAAYDIPDSIREVVNNMHNEFMEAFSEEPGGENGEGGIGAEGAIITLDLCLGLLAQRPQGLIFEDNTVYGKLIGLGILGSSTQGNRICNNNIYGNRFGVGLLMCNQHTVDVKWNRIEYNTVGFTSLMGGKVDATENWWGAVDWLKIRSTILGEVDAYNINTIEYFPWALNENCTKIANADLTQLVVNPAWKGSTIGLQVMYNNMDYYIGINAFPDIRGAVKAASTDYYFYYTDFATVNIVPGTYFESLTGNAAIVSPLTLRKMPGSGSGSVTITGDMEIYAEGVVVDGLSINGSITALVWPYGHVEIINNTIHNPGGQGILFIVEGLEADDSGEEFSVADLGSISSVTVKGNRITSDFPNIEFFAGIPTFINDNFTIEEDGSVDFVALANIISRANYNATVKLPENDIISFEVEGQLGVSEIDLAGHMVTFRMPNGSDVTSLTPQIIVSSGATISPDSGNPQDFTNPVIYTVTSAGGLAQEWVVVCIIDRGTDIISFSVPGQVGEAEIDASTYTVTFWMPYGTDASNLELTPAVEVSPGATLTPASGTVWNFSDGPDSDEDPDPVICTVRANDGTEQQWTVVCEIERNSDADITSFSVPEQVGSTVIDNVTNTVVFYVPYGTDVTTLVPTITVSDQATIQPESGVITDFSYVVGYSETSSSFSTLVTYTVTAGDGTQEEWNVFCVVNPNTEAEIISFEVPGQVGSSIIDRNTSRITFKMPYDARDTITALAPVITVSEWATIIPASEEPRDFSTPVAYLVISDGGVTAKAWVVECIVASNENDILTFTVDGQEGDSVIDAVYHTVEFTMPAGSVINALTPSITVSPGATISPNPADGQDFTSPVTYTVTAEDGTIQVWIVTCKVAGESDSTTEPLFAPLSAPEQGPDEELNGSPGEDPGGGPDEGLDEVLDEGLDGVLDEGLDATPE